MHGKISHQGKTSPVDELSSHVFERRPERRQRKVFWTEFDDFPHPVRLGAR
jgi:hypothetical protein